MRKSVKVWLHGLATAAIHASATAVSGVVVAPNVFNLTRPGLQHIGELVFVPALMAVSAKLSQSPLPPLECEDTPPPAPEGA